MRCFLPTAAIRAAAVCAGLALVGATAPAATGQAPAQYTFATVNNMNHLPEFVGVEKGIFVKHGIDLKLKVLNSGAEAMRAFQAGDAQFETTSPTIIAAAFNNGIKLAAVVQIMGDPTRIYYDDMFAITAHEGSGIRPSHLEDLAGKRVGMVLAGNGEIYLRSALAKAKIPADRITFVNVPAPEHVAVMRSKAVDAEVTWEPYGTMIVQQVPKAYVVGRGGGVVGYQLWAGTSEEFLKKNPEVVQRVVDGFAEAEWYIRHHKREAAEIATRWIEGLDATSAEKAITFMNFDPRFSADSVKAADLEQRGLVEQGRIKQTVDFSQALARTFVDRARHDAPKMFADLRPAR